MLQLHKLIGKVLYVLLIATLLAIGTGVNAQISLTPLHIAAFKGHAEVATTLLTAGADVNARAKYGFTPLHRAATEGHAEVATTLLTAGADVTRDEDGRSPLHWAALKGHAETIVVLLEAGADPLAKALDSSKPIDNIAENLKHTDVFWRLHDVSFK